MRIIGYVRLSRAHREESTSIERQRAVIRATCEARGFTLVEICEDPDASATKTRLDRPGLSRVRQLIGHGHADAVMVWRLDRLVRSVVDVGVLLDEGLHIISATESLDTTSPMGRAMVEILQVFASMEAKTTGLRVSASQEHLRRVGRFPGGVVPYGYRAVPHPSGVGRALEPHPEEAAVVRRLADGVLAGRSVYALTAELNAEGIPPRRPLRKLKDGTLVRREWGPTTIQRILRSDAIMGRVRVGGKRDARSRVLQPADVVRDDDGMPIEFWTPVLPLEDVERIRQLTEWQPTPGRAEATIAGRRRKAARMLSGLLACPGCGGNLVVKTRRSSTGHSIYACQAAAQGRVCAGGVAVECYRVEAVVEEAFLGLLGRLPVLEARRVSRPVAELAAVAESITATTDAMRNPGADLGALAERLTRLHARRAALGEVPETRVEQIETGETFAEAWAAADYMWRRQALMNAGVVVTVAPARQRGKWDLARVRVEFLPGDWDADVDAE